MKRTFLISFMCLFSLVCLAQEPRFMNLEVKCVTMVQKMKSKVRMGHELQFIVESIFVDKKAKAGCFSDCPQPGVSGRTFSWQQTINGYIMSSEASLDLEKNQIKVSSEMVELRSGFFGGHQRKEKGRLELVFPYRQGAYSSRKLDLGGSKLNVSLDCKVEEV